MLEAWNFCIQTKINLARWAFGGGEGAGGHWGVFVSPCDILAPPPPPPPLEVHQGLCHSNPASLPPSLFLEIFTLPPLKKFLNTVLLTIITCQSPAENLDCVCAQATRPCALVLKDQGKHHRERGSMCCPFSLLNLKAKTTEHNQLSEFKWQNKSYHSNHKATSASKSISLFKLTLLHNIQNIPPSTDKLSKICNYNR